VTVPASPHSSGGKFTPSQQTLEQRKIILSEMQTAIQAKYLKHSGLSRVGLLSARNEINET
jgi:hypothetical protein